MEKLFPRGVVYLAKVALVATILTAGSFSMAADGANAITEQFGKDLQNAKSPSDFQSLYERYGNNPTFKSVLDQNVKKASEQLPAIDENTIRWTKTWEDLSKNPPPSTPPPLPDRSLYPPDNSKAIDSAIKNQPAPSASPSKSNSSEDTMTGLRNTLEHCTDAECVKNITDAMSKINSAQKSDQPAKNIFKEAFDREVQEEAKKTVTQPPKNTTNTQTADPDKLNVPFSGGWDSVKKFTGKGDGNTINGFATVVWNITAIIITSLAVLLLIIGGFQIMVGGASSEQVEAGKHRVFQTIAGLALFYSIGLILHTILPFFFTINGSPPSP